MHNKIAFQSEIAFESLPQTFQDAVTTCRRLQIEYIWIDSLCIIQDDPDDWLHESSLMHKVYANSLCNLAATAAENSSVGLFFDRDVSKLQPCWVEIPSKENSTVRYHIGVDYMWERNVSNAPLNQRAWVLQERLLARRILHFAKEQLAWECCEMEATESHPMGQSGDAWSPPRFKLLDPKLVSPASVQYEKDPVTLWPCQKWQNVVQIYSSTGLTKACDKLVALSGLASHFKTICNDEYVAGMWKRFLCSQLLWTVAYSKEAVRAPKYRAPSFSWAALDGEIVPAEITESGILAEILNISIERSDGGELGPVTGGHLVMSGRMMRIQTKKRVYRKSAWKLITINDQDVYSVPEFSMSLWCADIDVRTETPPQPAYLLQIQHRTPTDGAAEMRCLVLAHIHGTQGDYVRIGHSSTLEGEALDVLQQPGGEEKIPCERYDVETGHHVIRLF
jgi:hypothetical protein